ncbi:CFEM domain-containing protein [Fusarium sp. LHS14.1]|nr:CFEM domain-containing protein [Fusarium sp. LHS14.1]
MAHSNAAEFAKAVPECVSGCFNIGVAATGCGEDDFDCWCYDKNHETIVDTMSECLDNRERKLKESCSKDEMFRMAHFPLLLEDLRTVLGNLWDCYRADDDIDISSKVVVNFIIASLINHIHCPVTTGYHEVIRKRKFRYIKRRGH